jgi:hypothetical protein
VRKDPLDGGDVEQDRLLYFLGAGGGGAFVAPLPPL